MSTTDDTLLNVRDDIREHGVAILRDVLLHDELNQLRTSFLEVLNKHGWLSSSHEPHDAIPSRHRQEGCFGWFDCFSDLQRIEQFHKLTHNPALVSAMSVALDREVFSHGQRGVSLVYPKCWIPPHQDFASVQGAVDTLTVWIPLDGPHDKQPSLRFFSKLDTKIQPLHRTNTDGAAIRIETDDPEWRTTDLRLGDVAIYHSLTIHEVTPNFSENIAFYCEFRYQASGEPICPGSVKPKHWPRVPDWDNLSAGWFSDEWVQLPENLNIVPYKMPTSLETWHEEIEVPQSRVLRCG